MNDPYQLQTLIGLYERKPAPEGAVGGRWRYTMISASAYTYDGTGALRTPHPPAVGDQISLRYHDGEEWRPGTFKVLARRWEYPMRGGMAWRAAQDMPDYTSSLDIVVERIAPGEELFADEAELTDEERDA